MLKGIGVKALFNKISSGLTGWFRRNPAENPKTLNDVVMFRSHALPLAVNDEGFTLELMIITPCAENREMCFAQCMKIRADGSRELEEQKPSNILVGDFAQVIYCLKEWERDHPGYDQFLVDPIGFEKNLKALVSKTTQGSIPPHYKVVEKIIGHVPPPDAPPPSPLIPR